MNWEKDIFIKVNLGGKEFELKTYEGEYRNLMMLLYDRLYLEDFGECKGIGRCGTCHVILLNPSEELLRKEGNENSTLSKHSIVSDNSRLACQIMIDKSISGLQVQVDLNRD